MVDKHLVLFLNTHAVMRAEKICALYQIPYQVIPVPTHISSECGMCLEIDFKVLVKLKDKLLEKKIPFTVTIR